MAWLPSLEQRGEEAPFRQDHHDVVPDADLVEEPHLLKGAGEAVFGGFVSPYDLEADAVDDYHPAVEGQYPAQ